MVILMIMFDHVLSFPNISQRQDQNMGSQQEVGRELMELDQSWKVGLVNVNSHHHNKYRDEIAPFWVGWCSNHWDIETNPCGHGNQHPARHGLRTTFGAGSGCFQRIPWPESWHVARSWFSTEKPKDLFFFWSQSLNQIHFFHVQKGKIFRSF